MGIACYDVKVEQLKRNLLRLIRVGVFSPAAEWQDPCASFVLSEVVCTSCNHYRNLDLCREYQHSDNDEKMQVDIAISVCLSHMTRDFHIMFLIRFELVSYNSLIYYTIKIKNGSLIYV